MTATSERLESLKAALSQKILVLDGAMGTLIQAQGLNESHYRNEALKDHTGALFGNHDLLNLTRPEVIRAIHEGYLQAGSDIIETNTFNTNHFSQADYGTEALVSSLAEAAAHIARQACEDHERRTGRPAWVAGVLGPTNRTASLSPDVEDPAKRTVTFDQLAATYADAALGLAKGGADFWLIETVFDSINAKAAVYACLTLQEQQKANLPIAISATIVDQSGRLLNGQTIEAFWVAIQHAQPLFFGLNCALGAREMGPHLRTLHDLVTCALSVHPNAGLPNELGGYDETPEEMAALMASYAQAGLLNVIGGCCGTTPEHIRKFRDIADHCRPRKCPSLPPLTQVSGLEVHTIGRERLFTNIGERTNVAGSTQFKKRIEQGKYANALRIAQEQIQNGAQMLDINMDAPLVDSNQAMALFLRHLMGEPDLARVPLMIDSSSFQTLVTGIKHCLGKPVANSISLKEGEESFLSQARELKKLGATVLIMAFDETGQADSHQRKVDIIRRSFTLLTAQAGFLPQDLIFDLNVFAIGTGMTEHDHYALATLTALEELSRTYPHCQFSGGISNLSFAFRGVETIREALNSVFLYHAFQRGLYLGIVNPGQLTVYDQIEPSLRQLCEALIFNQNPHATAELLDLATVLRQQEPAQQGKETPTSVDELTPEERIVAALIKGDDRHVVSDVEEVRLKLKDPLSVINGPLMSGMREVGERFGEGKMFLPQVVKAARVMKKAVGYLRPFIEEHTSSAQSRGTIVLATVKGDVHDIGKSIVGVVLGCNGFEVLDLGVMVPAGEILGKAKEIKADAIGLSGLITPSLQEMIHVAQEMTAQQWTIPLLIGGATTSVKHTALKIEPHYQGRVFHANDASGAAALLSQLFSEDREEITEQTQRQYERIRAQHKRPKIAKRSLMEARALRPVLHWNEKDHPRPTLVQSLIQQTWTPLDLIDWLDWWAFFQTWQLRGKYPAILDHPQKGEEARRLQNSALTLLKSPQWQEALSVGTLCGFFPAQSEEESVVFRNLEDETVTLTFPRQSLPQREDKGHRCLADFIAPPQSGFQDHLGLFAVSTRKAYLDVAASFQERSDDFHSLMIKICADRLAEAATEKLHFQVRTQLWGYDREENLPIEAMLKEQYRGIRPAPGYPACPDHTLKVPIWETLQVKERLGVQLTEHYAMDPPASVCGFFFAHPQAHYFSAGTEEEA